MKKILIVDDSEVNLLLIQTIFSDDQDIKIILESDSTKALSLVRSNIPDLIVLDLMMPNIDGFEILKEIHNDNTLNRIPIIVVSARHDHKSIEAVMDYGVRAYIKKPIDLKDVEEKIRMLLNENQIIDN